MWFIRRPLRPLPASFRFGVATADHQCEAYQPGRDDVWDLWERRLGLQQRGRATDFWNRYPEDVALARDLGCRAFRFSIAWTRVEPSPGQYDESAFDHYRDVIRTIRESGMEPFVTLLHFVWPPHVQERGGLIGPDFPGTFERYADAAARRFGDAVRFWIPINEPNGLVYGYVKPWWQMDYASPPGLPPETTLDEQIDAVGALIQNLFRAHAAARAAIKRHVPDARVGSNPLPLGLPPWLQSLLDRNAGRLEDRETLARQVSRLAERPMQMHGRVDVAVATLSRTAGRARRVAFSTDYHVTQLALLVPSASIIAGGQDLSGKAVALCRGTTAQEFLRDLAPGARALLVASELAALDALDRGAADAVLADDSILRGLIGQHRDRYRVVDLGTTEQRYAAAVPQGNTALLEVVNRAIERFKMSGAWASSVARHFGDAAQSIPRSPGSLSEQTAGWLQQKSQARIENPAGPLPLGGPGSALRRIQDRGYVVVGVRADTPGFSAREPSSGNLAGLEVDLAHGIAAEIFGDADRLRFRVVTPAERVAALRSPLGFLDPLLRTYSIVATGITSNWWHLGMAGKLPRFLCPSDCVDQQDFVAFDYYWGIRTLRLDRIQRLFQAANRQFEDAPVWPGALGDLLRYHARLFPGLPIVICENGSVDVADGVNRVSYLRRHVRQVQRAVARGIPVVAYLCWSITSNREWGTTFGPGNDFGVYHVDLDHDPELTRVATPSAAAYREIIFKRSATVD